MLKVCSPTTSTTVCSLRRIFWCDHLFVSGRAVVQYTHFSPADEPDFELTCVGQWDENWESFMITWDPEDETTPFRCWVRAAWTHVIVYTSCAYFNLLAITAQLTHNVATTWRAGHVFHVPNTGKCTVKITWCDWCQRGTRTRKKNASM